jgi:alkanesulfonate monooxygenase SsuD/methylene tetrahydromethanopterin reductase-like flavin-dependent oxidoreductase (luciferase family)
LYILRGMWDHAGGSFSYEGDVYTVSGARPGPGPAHVIPLWTGATGPQMLRLTGQLADGIWVSLPYVPPARLAYVNEKIDEGATAAGRPPTAIRRGYNVGGTITAAGGKGSTGEQITGPAAYWTEVLLRLHDEHRVDTFNLWPAAGDEPSQLERFAHDVIPAVRAAVAAE